MRNLINAANCPPNQGFQQARFNRAQKHRAMHAIHYGAGLVVLQVVYADYHLIRGAVFSLTIPCPMNGLVTSRSALHLKLGKICITPAKARVDA